MEKYEVKVDEAVVGQLQSLGVEIAAMKGVITGIITDNPNNPAIIDTPLFKEYSRRYGEKNAEFDVLKTRMSKTYIPAEHIDRSTWSLDYDTGILSYTLNNDPNVCANCAQ